MRLGGGLGGRLTRAEKLAIDEAYGAPKANDRARVQARDRSDRDHVERPRGNSRERRGFQAERNDRDRPREHRRDDNR